MSKSSACEYCGKPGYIEGLHTHHLYERSVAPERKKDPANLVNLCPSCHDRAHKDYHFLRQLRERFDGKRRDNEDGKEYDWDGFITP